MKYDVDSDEWYPVYSFSDAPDSMYKDGVIELSAEERADFDRVLAEFQAWQDRIGKALDARPPA